MLPRMPAGTLRTARLLETLDFRRGSPLSVVDAGAGYGKTTLVRSSCAERPEAVTCMTLDAADDDPGRLWAQLATARASTATRLGRITAQTGL